VGCHSCGPAELAATSECCECCALVGGEPAGAQVLVPCYTEALDIVAESVWAAHVAPVRPRPGLPAAGGPG